MTGRKVIFRDVQQVDVEPFHPPQPAANQLRVQVQYSAISAGTELLLYRGQFPRDMQLDANIEALSGGWSYPLAYGYAVSGTVDAVGEACAPDWLGREVFAFQPHTSHFLAQPDDLLPIPADISLKEALFLPNMETAVSFLMDGQPMIGEKVAVLGLGVVGQLTTMLLAQYPLTELVAVDLRPYRQRFATEQFQVPTMSPAELMALIPEVENRFDLSFELSGSPEALDMAIEVTGDYGRVLIGSWYGEKRATLNLGGRFHRSHMRLISSQVSNLKAEWRGRWDKGRRLELVWEMIRRHRPGRLISNLIPIEEAPRAYAMLDQKPADCLQIVLSYQGE